MNHKGDCRVMVLAILVLTLFYVYSAGNKVSSQGNRSDSKSLRGPERKQTPVAESASLYLAKEPVSCESFGALVDTEIVNWHHNPDAHLIFIVRPGEREMTAFNQSRLTEIDAYLKRYKKIKYVIAQGQSLGRTGQIEIYVAGKLSTVIPVRRNSKHVCVGSVNPFLGASPE